MNFYNIWKETRIDDAAPNLFFKTADHRDYAQYLEKVAFHETANKPIEREKPFDFLDTYYFFDEEEYPAVYVELKEKEILYDYYSLSSTDTNRFVVSERFKQLLEQFQLPQDAHFYPCLFLYKGEKILYYLFQLYSNLFTYSDGAKNKYATYTGSLKPANEMVYEPYLNNNINVSTILEIRDNLYQNENKSLTLSKVHLIKKLDILSVDFVRNGSYIIVSEDLKNAIERANFIGMRFEELHFEVFFENNIVL